MGSLQAQKEAAMKNKCPYSHDGKCDIWIDYEVLRYAQDESNELLHSNWSEIVYLLDRVRKLEKYIVSIGGEVPPEE